MPPKSTFVPRIKLPNKFSNITLSRPKVGLEVVESKYLPASMQKDFTNCSEDYKTYDADILDKSDGTVISTKGDGNVVSTQSDENVVPPKNDGIVDPTKSDEIDSTKIDEIDPTKNDTIFAPIKSDEIVVPTNTDEMIVPTSG